MKNGKCPYGCVLTTICKHLEKELPSTASRSVTATRVKDIEMFAEGELHAPIELATFLESITGFALNPSQVNVLVGRHVTGLTFSEIASEFDFTNAQQAHRLYKLTLKTLKKGGYNVKE